MKARTDQSVVRDLRELVAALDRRVPRLEREGERVIAVDAEALKRAALKRIAELERSSSAPGIGIPGQETATAPRLASARVVFRPGSERIP